MDSNNSFSFPRWMDDREKKKKTSLSLEKCRIHQNIKTDGESSD